MVCVTSLLWPRRSVTYVLADVTATKATHRASGRVLRVLRRAHGVARVAPVEIGVLHPGEMGAGIAFTLVEKGHHVWWVPAGRSAETAGRAGAAGMEAASSLAEMVGRCELIVSICPPHVALTVARQVAAGPVPFEGIYLDANAIAPATAEAVAAIVRAAGGRYLDGGVIGAPPSRDHPAQLYLSGLGASSLADQLSTPALDVRPLGDSPIAASALKMAYASWTKGTAALLLAIRATADHYGVDAHLVAEWARSVPVLIAQSDRAAVSAMTKGWRWIGEMEEIAATFRGADIPDGFGTAAAEVYRRVPRQEPCGDQADLIRVLDDLAGREGT